MENEKTNKGMILEFRYEMMEQSMLANERIIV